MTLPVDPSRPSSGPADTGEPYGVTDGRSSDAPGPAAPAGVGVGAGPPERRSGRGRGGVRGTVEWVVILAVALVGALVIRTFFIQAFYIPSDSMVPTLVRHDRVLVNKVSYRMHAVHRGDVVVFVHSPGFDPTITDLIKRVIGLPGETISAQAGHIIINGRPLAEPYLPAGSFTNDFGPRVIPSGDYFVMGDNRGNSSDSRYFGPIARSQLVGRAFVLVWPLNRLRLL